MGHLSNRNVYVIRRVSPELVGKKVNEHRIRPLLSSLGFGPFIPPLASPALLDDLAGAAQGQSVSRNVFRDGGTCGHVSAFADANGRYQRGVAADKSAFFNDGHV